MATFGLGLLLMAVVTLGLGFAGVIHGAGGLVNMMFLTSFVLLIGSELLPRLHRHHHHHPR